MAAIEGEQRDDHGEVATGIQAASVIVFEDQMAEFEAKLAKLNAKASAFGLDPVSILDREDRKYWVRYSSDDGEHFSRTLIRYEDGDKIPVADPTFVRGTKFEISYPLIKLGDWKVLGMMETMGQDNLLYAFSRDEEDRRAVSAYRDCPVGCDHCNTKRRRNQGFILRDARSGEVKQVGTSCLEDFTGIDPAAALFLAKLQTFFRVAEGDEMGDERIGRMPAYMSLQTYLARVLFVVSEEGFVSTAKAREASLQGDVMSPTYERAMSIDLRGSSDEMQARRDRYMDTAQKRDEDAQTIMDWVRGLDRSKLDDFALNLHTLFQNDEVSFAKPRHLAIIAAAIPTYHRHMTKEQERSKAAPQPVSRHVGEAGQKMSADLTLVRVASFESFYGLQFIVSMKDAEGNAFVWKTASPPDELTDAMSPGRMFHARFTIKGHGEYKGVLQTDVQRLKFEGWVPQAAQGASDQADPDVADDADEAASAMPTM